MRSRIFACLKVSPYELFEFGKEEKKKNKPVIIEWQNQTTL